MQPSLSAFIIAHYRVYLCVRICTLCFSRLCHQLIIKGANFCVPNALVNIANMMHAYNAISINHKMLWIAHDMRRKVYSLLKQGKTEQEVIAFMKSRYGDFVHYQPPVTAATLWLWAGPVLFIFIALIVVVRRKSVTPPEDMAAKLAKADEMLEREKE